MSKLRQLTKKHEDKAKFHVIELRKNLVELGYNDPTPGTCNCIFIWEHTNGDMNLELSNSKIKIVWPDIVNQSIRCEKLPKWHLRRWMKSFIQSGFAKLSGKSPLDHF